VRTPKQHGRRQRGGKGAAALCALCPAPGCPPVVVRKKLYVPLDPSRPLSQRKFYVKIHEMCQNTAHSMLNFFSFPVVNGQSTCCKFSSVESPITTIFFATLSPLPCPSLPPTSKIPVPPMRKSLFQLKQNALVVKRFSCFSQGNQSRQPPAVTVGMKRLRSSFCTQLLLSWRQAAEEM